MTGVLVLAVVAVFLLVLLWPTRSRIRSVTLGKRFAVDTYPPDHDES